MKRGVVLALMGLAIGAAIVSVVAWRVTGPSQISLTGYIALGLCLLFGIALTIGLMWLMFYSANHGYDDIDRD